MGVPITRPMAHTQTTFTQSVLQRSASPAFLPPVPTGEYVPHDNYIRIITAKGPFTTEQPRGTGPGINVGANNMPQHPVGPLTRKGG